MRIAAALGDGPGLIDPHEKERNPLRTGTLQGRQPVADLLDRGPEPVGEDFQIVAGLLRGRKEGAIGHQRCAREIIRQPDLGDGARRVGLKPRQIERRLQQLILRQQRQLQQHLEGPRFGFRTRR